MTKRILISAITLQLLLFGSILAQKVGFVSSDIIRNNYPEAKQAEQRIQSIVEEWKRELDFLQKEIDALDFEVQKNRLVWSDQEKAEKEKELEDKKTNRKSYAKAKFESGGEYDNVVKSMMTPVEQKIYGSVQQVATDEGYDFIFDQSAQPIPYLNFKYDLTVKVLRKLGVDVEELDKQLQTKIDTDPRNQKKESFQPRKKRRTRKPGSDQPDDGREIERDPNDNTKPPVNPPFDKPLIPDTTKLPGKIIR